MTRMAHILSVAVAARFDMLVAEQGQMLDTERTDTERTAQPPARSEWSS